MQPELSIIILNWNSVQFLKPCLNSILQNSSGLSFEVIIIDGASFDGSAGLISESYPWVRFIQAQQNVGFAKGNNIAAGVAEGDYLLFLNPDTIVRGDALVALLSVLKNNANAGAVGAKLINTNGSLQTSCIQSFPTVINQFLDSEFLRKLTPSSRLWGMAPLFSGGSAPSSVEAISGACVMIRSKLFHRIGGFTEAYFMYSEDLDLSFKVQQAGMQCLFVPGAEVIHHGGGSSKSAENTFSTVMMRESVYRFLKLRRGIVSALAFRFFIGASALIRLPLLGVLALKKGTDEVSCSVKKWVSILRWGLGLETWIRKYEASTK